MVCLSRPRWIVWKLASYARAFPDAARADAGTLLSKHSVLSQLKYRYEREVNRAQFSALRRVLEQDCSPATPMVLCVSAVRSMGRDGAPASANRSAPGTSALVLLGDKAGGGGDDSAPEPAEVELTDGW